jgi:hypothetical protein
LDMETGGLAKILLVKRCWDPPPGANFCYRLKVDEENGFSLLEDFLLLPFDGVIYFFSGVT